MKVTFINRVMGVFRGGGENFDLNIAAALESLGCDIHFIIGRKLHRLDVPFDEFPVTYISTPYLRWLMYWAEGVKTRSAKAIGYRAARLDLFLFEMMVLRKIINSHHNKSDVFQICGLPRLASWIEETLHKPAVVWWPGPPGERLNRYYGKYSANIANGDAFEKVIFTDHHAIEINLGIDISRFKKEGINRRGELNISKKDVVLLFVGRLIPVKNLCFLLKGFARALRSEANLKLILVGDGNERRKLYQDAIDLEIINRVTFAGAQPTDSVAEFYRTSDIFVLTSSYDNFPNVILEAMASELPVIATRVGGIMKQIKEDANGFLVNCNDVEELAKKIVCLAQSRDMRREIGRKNRVKIINEYKWLESGRKLLRLYEKICRDKK